MDRILNDFEGRVYCQQKEEKVADDWTDFLECKVNRPQVNVEKSLTCYIFRFGENNQIEDMKKIPTYFEMCDYSETVNDDL